MSEVSDQARTAIRETASRTYAGIVSGMCIREQRLSHDNCRAYAIYAVQTAPFLADALGLLELPSGDDDDG